MFYLCLQNGPLPFSKFEFLVAWILREVLSIWMTIQSHRTSIVQWRHKKYRVLWGGTIEEFVWFLSCQEERTRTREFRSPSASHFLVENCCHGLGIFIVLWILAMKHWKRISFLKRTIKQSHNIFSGAYNLLTSPYLFLNSVFYVFKMCTFIFILDLFLKTCVIYPIRQ